LYVFAFLFFCPLFSGMTKDTLVSLQPYIFHWTK
jgi:hypothetical protein